MISELWEKYGFTILVVGSILFFLISWILGLKPKRGRAGRIRDYIQDILNPEEKKQHRKRNPKKTENMCRDIVEDIFKKPFPSVRPDFLRNPETNRNMECDMMNSDLKICIEYNGRQHYHQVSHFQNTQDFKKQLERDQLKKKLLEKNGYRLIEIPYTIHQDILHKYIPYKLSQYPEYKPYVDHWNR